MCITKSLWYFGTWSKVILGQTGTRSGFRGNRWYNFKIWYRNNWLWNNIFEKNVRKIIFPWKFLSRVPNFITGSLYNISIDYRLLLIQVQFQFKIILNLFKIKSGWSPLHSFDFSGPSNFASHELWVSRKVANLKYLKCILLWYIWQLV